MIYIILFLWCDVQQNCCFTDITQTFQTTLRRMLKKPLKMVPRMIYFMKPPQKGKSLGKSHMIAAPTKNKHKKTTEINET